MAAGRTPVLAQATCSLNKAADENSPILIPNSCTLKWEIILILFLCLTVAGGL